MPDIVLFLVGTNDVIAGDQPARTAVNIRKVVSEMHQVNPSVTILLSLLIPNYASDGAVRRAKELNRMLPAVVNNLNQQLQKQTKCNKTTIVDPTAHCHLDGRHRHVDRKDREKETACYQERMSRDNAATGPDVCRCRRCATTAAELRSNQTVVLRSVGRGLLRSMLGRDGTHPNAEGNALMAANWFGALKHILPPPTRPAYVRPSPTAPLRADDSADTETEVEAGAPAVSLDAAPSPEANEAGEASVPETEPEPSPRALPADEHSALSSGSVRTVFGLVLLLLLVAVFGRKRCPK
uniref:SGNH hydrolase-type esterase domain-containing protein n=1 Tax=Eutreptiella gymnastica TaxID=73025 RepID=A0A6U7X3H5_9EUGL